MIQPTRDRVLIKPDPVEEVSKGGLVLTGVDKKRYSKGVVIRVGPGKTLNDGAFVKTEVKIGERVVFPEGSSMAIEIEEDIETGYILMSEDSILAVEEKHG